MAYTINWLVPNRVVHLHVYGHVSLSEARAAYAALQLMHDQGIAPIHLILEHTGIERFPLTLNLYNFIIDGGHPEKAGWMLIVGENRQAVFIGRLFSYVTNIPSATFPDYDHAIQFLYQQDPTLLSAKAS